MNLKNISKACSKSSTKLGLSYIRVYPQKVVATNSFILAEVKHESNMDGYLLGKACEKLNKKAVVSATGASDGLVTVPFANSEGFNYPDNYETLKPTAEPVATITLTKEYLIDLLKACDDSFVKIDFHSVNKPLIIKGQKKETREFKDGEFYGLIMGITR